MISLKLLLFNFVAFSAKHMVSSDKVIWCYYNTAAVKLPGQGKFDFEDHFHPNLCTHLAYGFLGVDHETGAVTHLDESIDLAQNGGLDYLEKMILAKKVNPNLKTILSVGGWDVPSRNFSLMAEYKARRKTFISSALHLVQEFKFDGVDIAWFFPNGRDTIHGNDDSVHFSLLLKELYEEFHGKELLVSAAVRPWKADADRSYYIPEITKHLDYVNLMTFESHRSIKWYSRMARHGAPLHKGEGDRSPDKLSQRTVDVAVDYWIQQGCPRDKILLGIPFFGVSFTLKDPNNWSPGAPSEGKGITGQFVKLDGHIGYNELCSLFQTSNWRTTFDPKAQAPYAVQDKNWVSYDDPISVEKKVGHARITDIAGVMIWTIDTDDFRGTCTAELNFHLLRNVNRQMNPH